VSISFLLNGYRCKTKSKLVLLKRIYIFFCLHNPQLFFVLFKDLSSLFFFRHFANNITLYIVFFKYSISGKYLLEIAVIANIRAGDDMSVMINKDLPQKSYCRFETIYHNQMTKM